MEMFGLCRVKVNDDLKVCKIEVFSYYDLFKKLDRFDNVNHFFCIGKIVQLLRFRRYNTIGPLKVCKIEAFFDPDSFLLALEGKLDPDELNKGQALIGDISKTAIEKATCPRKKWNP